MNDRVATKVKTNTKASERVYTEFNKIGVISLALVSGAIGIWAITSLVVAASTLGLGALAKGFFVAVGLV